MIRSILEDQRHNNTDHTDQNSFFYRFATLFFLVTWLGVPTSAVGPGCERTCGDVDVPYPFGIGDPSCAMVEADEEFLLSCNTTWDGSRKLFMRSENIRVLGISLEEATVSISIPSAYKCYDGSEPSSQDQPTDRTLIDIHGPFTFSSAHNRLVTLGCDSLAMMQGDNKFWSGCVSMCSENVNLTKEGACSGLGCCQTSLPKNIKSLEIQLGSIYNHTGIQDFNPCDFAMLVDQRTQNVSTLNLGFRPGDPAVTNVSVLLDWIVRNETCEEAQMKGRDYACGDNSDCYYSDDALGYRCQCSSGFQGNPYLKGPQGCTDIDECKQPQKYPCHGTCKNTVGGYDCHCPLGMHGDGKRGNCEGFRVTTIVSVAGGSLSILIISALFFYDFKRRKRERIFRENGGLVLKHQRVRIFSSKELSKATNNYNEAQLLGKGGFASVYKGVITKDRNGNDTQVVAVKKPKDDLENSKNKNKNKNNNQQFHEEMAIVSQVNHKNVVKLLGICLETKTPLLVYEYVPNGTLHNHIHKKSSTVLKPWKSRLKIAVETALALDYLHSLADPPIIHGDVKSSNILLDENYAAKVSDFGASVLIPPDQTGIATTVRGTLGYLDPEYLNTGTLTTKSDVYSFGVVLLELVTGEKPVSRIRTGPKSNIIQYFVSKVLESRGASYADEILDEEIVRDDSGHETEQIEAVAELAVRCLEISGALRPSMREVAEELTRLSKARKSTAEGDSRRLLSANSDARSSRRNRSSYELIEFTRAFDAMTDQSSFDTSINHSR